MSARLGDWCETYTGRHFWPLDPKPEEVSIDDIAHALSLTCRYNGHCKYLYSVGQHSILCVILARINRFNPRIQLLALLHDAAEAYVSDVTRPIKPYLKGYQEMEDRIHRTILCALDIPGAYPVEADCVNEIDNEMLATEAKILMPCVGWSNLGYEPRTDILIVERRPAAVEEEFKVLLEQLMREARDVIPADGYSACLMHLDAT